MVELENEAPREISPTPRSFVAAKLMRLTDDLERVEECCTLLRGVVVRYPRTRGCEVSCEWKVMSERVVELEYRSRSVCRMKVLVLVINNKVGRVAPSVVGAGLSDSSVVHR